MTEKVPMICKECDNDDEFDEEDGFFYCQQCGVRADDMMAFAVDVEDLVGEGGGTRGAIYQRIHTRRLPPSQLITPSQLRYEDYYGQVRDRYVNGFLTMITLQCDALVERFNVTPLIIGLVGPICLRFVSLSGVFDDGWADKAILDSELQSKEVRESKRCNRDKGLEPRNLDGKRAVTIWVSQLRKSLPLSSSRAISFLACHKAGATVLPTDIVRWAREGEVPYQSCFLTIQEKMGKRSAACPVEASVMFRPLQVVSAQRLEARAASIADIIGLRLPPVNLCGIASNYLKRLSIPEDKVLDLVRLIQKWSMPSDLYLSKNELRLPTRVCVMSIVIVALRMLYNINGFGAWERSLGVVTSNEEGVVSEEHDEEVSETKPAAEELSDVTKATEFDTEELLKNLEAKYYDVAAESVECEKDLLSYLSHGRNELFAGLVEASADDTYKTVDNLWNGYTKDKGSKQFETPLKRGRDWEDDDVSFNQLSLDEHTKFGDGDNPCSGPSRRSESMSMENSSPENHNQEEEPKERSIRRLITDMRENLFCYIPPRVKVKRLGYLHYVRKIEDGAMIYPAHADYYILLRVCARVAEVDARNMHRGVLSFERSLALTEKKIDQVLHSTPPVMTRDGGNVAKDQDDYLVVSSRDSDSLI